jgi:DNA polymerase-1
MVTPSLVLIDGNNMFYKSFYAVKYNKQGSSFHKPNANGFLEAHVFLKMYLANISQFLPAAAIICWDGNQSAFRRQLFDGYKAKRIAMADARDPLELKRMSRLRVAMHEMFPKLGLCSVTVEGVEADDLIAYFYRKYREHYNVVVMSNDSDLKQFSGSLVCDLAGATHYIDHKTARLNILKKIVCGDTSDGINGVGGIGPKTFAKLLDTCGASYDAIVGHFSEDLQKVEILERNRRLVDLLRVNKLIVTPHAEAKLNKTMSKYLDNDFSKMLAVSHCIKIGLRSIAHTNIATTLESNYVHTSSFIRKYVARYTQRKAVA